MRFKIDDPTKKIHPCLRNESFVRVFNARLQHKKHWLEKKPEMRQEEGGREGNEAQMRRGLVVTGT